ncbi:MAG: HlyD family type I secretion periplasmic adaptor subunit [Hyphomicrobiales bacterium]
MYQREDLDFATEYNAALRQGPPKGTGVFLMVVGALFASFLAWASWAEVDEVTRGDGRVIPSGKNQEVENLEGGIVKEIMIKAGDIVQEGDVLLRIDATGFSSNLGELEAKRNTLETQMIRLRHELKADTTGDLNFSDELRQRAPSTVAIETQLYKARRSSLEQQISILNERVEQRKRELSELASNLTRLKENFELAEEEEAIKEPLAKRGIVPKTDLIRLRRELADLRGQIGVANETKPRLEAAVREAEALAEDQRLNFRREAQLKLSEKVAELAIVIQSIRGAQDRVQRAEVIAPVGGIVNAVNVNTIGGVVSAGESLVEIVPQEDSLLVEAKIRPSDIAFVHPGQPALVKITAYDFSIYGGLDGEVQQISADSAIDEQTNEVFYLVKIKTLTNQLGGNQSNLSIIPGMVASVDILTGKKSVLDYLLKPINKARTEALRER